MIYTITVSNIGGSAAGTDSVVLIDQIPAQMIFYYGDIDSGGPDVHPALTRSLLA